MMRVLLIDPPGLFLECSGLTRQVEPMGLGYVAAALAGEHDVRLLLPDTRSYAGRDAWYEIESAIAGEAPEVVGITVVTAALPAAARLVTLVKRLDPNIPVVIGGFHPTADPPGAISVTGADFAVLGEGEETARELLRAIGGRTAFDPSSIRGLAWKAPDGATLVSPPRPPAPEPGRLPWPMRDSLVWPGDIQPSFYQGVISARGCVSACVYCAAGLMGRGIRSRPVTDVLAEISWLQDRYGVERVFFHDSIFSADRSRTVELCAGLARHCRITFDCQTRADCLDAELLAAMAVGGCRHVMLGIESGDEETLRLIRKPAKLDRVAAVVEQIRSAGIRATGFFMVGWPWDDAARIKKTADFACSIGLDAVFLFSVTPLPGTELWAMVRARSARPVPAVPAVPAALDFRSPGINLTTMDDADYTRLFGRIKQRFDQYNSRLSGSGVHGNPPLE